LQSYIAVGHIDAQEREWCGAAACGWNLGEMQREFFFYSHFRVHILLFGF